MSQNTLLEEKYKNIFEEYNKDKADFKQTVDKYNDMLIENKLKLKTLEEKIKNFENEKKIIKETQDRNILENNQQYEDKINNLNMEINKLKSKIKTKEEEMLIEKLDKEQLSALDMQKITFLENEAKKWKERYNEQSKDLSEVKTEKIHLAADIDKLKTEIKNLKNKMTLPTNGDMNFEKKMNVTYGNSSSGFYSGGSRAINKSLIDLLSEQNIIKEFLTEIKNNTNKIIDMNKDIMNNVQNLNKKNKEKNDKKEIKGNNMNDLNSYNMNDNNGFIKFDEINKIINSKEEIQNNYNQDKINYTNNEELKTNFNNGLLKTNYFDEVLKNKNCNEEEIKDNIISNNNNNINNKADELKTIDNSGKDSNLNDIKSLKIKIINQVLKKNLKVSFI